VGLGAVRAQRGHRGGGVSSLTGSHALSPFAAAILACAFTPMLKPMDAPIPPAIPPAKDDASILEPPSHDFNRECAFIKTG